MVAAGFTIEDPCDRAGIPAQREGSSLETDERGLWTHCELTQPGGRVHEATEVHWYPAVTLLCFGVGAWFMVAGLLGQARRSRARTVVLASAGVFLLASLLWFAAPVGGPGGAG